MKKALAIEVGSGGSSPSRINNSASSNNIEQKQEKVNTNSERMLSDRDSDYMELAKDPAKNAEQLQRMVDQAAKDAG